jgi:transcriptional regulator with XRE-family HTH domain
MSPDLKLERIRRGVRQYHLAAALRVPQTTLCAWENGRRPMTPEQERAAFDALHTLAATERKTPISASPDREVADVPA